MDSHFFSILILLPSCAGLLCFSNSCPFGERNGVCVESCPSEYEIEYSCWKVRRLDYGRFTTVDLGCSANVSNCSNSTQCVPGPSNIENLYSCCCYNDYCNGVPTLTNHLLPILSISRLLPVRPFAGDLSGMLSSFYVMCKCFLTLPKLNFSPWLLLLIF